MATMNGICRNAMCANAKTAVLLERYEGPGEYCPECGDLLEPVESPAHAAPAAPFGGLTASEALKQFEVQTAPVVSPAPAPQGRSRRLVFGSIAIAAAALVAIVEFHAKAVGHPAAGDAVRVCRSSMTERFAGDVIRAYSEKSGTPTSRFELTRFKPAACDVRFAVSSDAGSAQAVGETAVVAVVNPENSVTHLSEAAIRGIFAGEITDWSAVGGTPGRIVAMLPAEGSDEAALLAGGLLRGVRIGASIVRLPTSAAVVRAVVRADKPGALALVAFGEAVPAKVLTLGESATPNPLSIVEGRYPLSLSVTVGVDGNARDSATALVQYARSEEAQAIVLRSGLVSKKGL